MLSAALPAPFSATLSPALSVYLCKCGAAGSASGQIACPFHPTLHQSPSRHGHVSPLHPGASLHPSYWSGCMFLFYLLGVRLPCCSIFCQFWLCEEAQCGYLCLNLGFPLLEFLFCWTAFGLWNCYLYNCRSQFLKAPISPSLYLSICLLLVLFL